MPNPASPVVETPSVYYGDGNISGHGSPEGVIPAWPGRGYVDLDTGDFYLKTSGEGTTSGWTVHAGGGGGGTGATFAGAGSPEGSQIGSPGNTYWDTSNSKFYVKHSGIGNTGWQELVGV